MHRAYRTTVGRGPVPRHAPIAPHHRRARACPSPCSDRGGQAPALRARETLQHRRARSCAAPCCPLGERLAIHLQPLQCNIPHITAALPMRLRFTVMAKGRFLGPRGMARGNPRRFAIAGPSPYGSPHSRDMARDRPSPYGRTRSRRIASHRPSPYGSPHSRGHLPMAVSRRTPDT